MKAHLLRQFFLCDQFTVKQKICNRRFGLVRNIRNQCFDLILLNPHILSGNRGGRKIIGKFCFQCRQTALIKMCFRVGALNRCVQHFFYGVHRFFRFPKVYINYQQCHQDTQQHHNPNPIIHAFFPTYIQSRKRFESVFVLPAYHEVS